MLPSEAAVYFVVDSDLSVKYVGSTVNLKQRFGAHHRSHEFRNLGCEEVRFFVAGSMSVDAMRDAEISCIKRLKPELNVYHSADVVPCPHCSSDRTYKNGHYRGKQRWRCENCDRSFTENPDPLHGGGRKPCKWPGKTQAERDAARMRDKRAKQKSVKQLREFQS